MSFARGFAYDDRRPPSGRTFLILHEVGVRVVPPACEVADRQRARSRNDDPLELQAAFGEHARLICVGPHRHDHLHRIAVRDQAERR